MQRALGWISQAPVACFIVRCRLSVVNCSRLLGPFVLRRLFSISILESYLALEHWLAPHQPAHSFDQLVDLSISTRGVLECGWLLRSHRRRSANIARAQLLSI